MRTMSLVVASLMLSTLVLGCGKTSERDGAPKGTVVGTVTFEGQPVSEGIVTLYSPSKGIGITTELSEGGAFTVKEPIEVGEYTVLVQPPPLPPPSEADMTPKPQAHDNIPTFYHSETSSDLRITIKEGENTGVTFDMKKKK